MNDNARKRQEDWERSLNAWKSKQNKEGMYTPVSHSPNHPHSSRAPHEEKTFLTRFLIFLAFAVPVAILGYALYINYLPFGYEKTYSLTIDESGVISPLSNEIYLTTPQGRKLLTLPNGVEGQVNLVLEPNVVLKDATIEVSLDGEGVYLASPIDISSIEWDNNWDFTSSVPEDWQGTAQHDAEQACTHFNAYSEQTLSLPNSEDMFENGPMSIYVKWKPSSISPLLGNNQQIIGHYNWEIYQGENELRFQVGRMNDANGTIYGINYPITDNFFNTEHEALAIYSPSEEGNGYIEFWVDNNLAGNVLIGTDIIYKDYNPNNDLSIGWSSHNFENNPYLDGCIYSTKITGSVIENKITSASLNPTQPRIIPIIGKGILKYIEVKVIQ